MKEEFTSHSQTPELLLAEGLQAHISGDFEGAIILREQAANLMSAQDPRYPGVQGTIALAYDRLGKHPEAVMAASIGYDTLYSRLKGGYTTSAHREILLNDRPSIELHLGIVLTRATAQAIVDGKPYDSKQFSVANKMLQAAHNHQKEQRAASKRIHQWDINMLRRRAGAIALDPNAGKLKGIGIGIASVAKGVLSESPRFVDGTSGIEGPHKHRKLLRAKTKTVLGGLAATTQCVLALSKSQPATRAVAKIAASRAVF